MKNEEKIIELLMEYIARTDRMEREFSQQMIELRKDFNTMQNNFNSMQSNFNSLQKDFNQSNVRQEELMKEVFRISKRVGDIEDRLQ